MRLLMHHTGVFDSEKDQLVGQEENDEKLCKQYLRLITSSSNSRQMQG